MKHETFPTSALDELVANVAAGFENARAMPKSVYTSEDFARLEMEKIFRANGSAPAGPRPWPSPATT